MKFLHSTQMKIHLNRLCKLFNDTLYKTGDVIVNEGQKPGKKSEIN